MHDLRRRGLHEQVTDKLVVAATAQQHHLSHVRRIHFPAGRSALQGPPSDIGGVAPQPHAAGHHPAVDLLEDAARDPHAGELVVKVHRGRHPVRLAARAALSGGPASRPAHSCGNTAYAPRTVYPQMRIYDSVYLLLKMLLSNFFHSKCTLS